MRGLTRIPNDSGSYLYRLREKLDLNLSASYSTGTLYFFKVSKFTSRKYVSYVPDSANMSCRDGVSEGQFYQVLLHEVDAIRKVSHYLPEN